MLWWPRLAALAWLACASAAADPQSKAYSFWTVQGQRIELRYEVAEIELVRLAAHRRQADAAQALAAELSETVSVRRSGAPCARRALRALRARTGQRRVAITFRCADDSGALEIRVRAFLDATPSHLHFASLRAGDGERVDQLLSRRNDRLLVPAKGADDARAPARMAAFASYLVAGTQHLLIGLDHLAFLLGLLLLTRRFLDGIGLVTGFTIGHSVTLSLAALDIVRPNAMAVEALIGFTISLVGAECLCLASRQHRRGALVFGGLFAAAAALRPLLGNGPGALALLGLAMLSACYLLLAEREALAKMVRPALTVTFGMVHGFGFAAALLSVGLPGTARLWALFGFNLGVELGQILVLCALLPIGLALRRWAPKQRVALAECAAAALCALGFYWYFSRAF